MTLESKHRLGWASTEQWFSRRQDATVNVYIGFFVTSHEASESRNKLHVAVPQFHGPERYERRVTNIVTAPYHRLELKLS